MFYYLDNFHILNSNLPCDVRNVYDDIILFPSQELVVEDAMDGSFGGLGGNGACANAL